MSEREAVVIVFWALFIMIVVGALLPHLLPEYKQMFGREVIEDFATRHETVRVIKNSSNIGCYNSVNRAFAEAKGDYVYLMSANDKVLPCLFEKSIAML